MMLTFLQQWVLDIVKSSPSRGLPQTDFPKQGSMRLPSFQQLSPSLFLLWEILSLTFAKPGTQSAKSLLSNTISLMFVWKRGIRLKIPLCLALCQTNRSENAARYFACPSAVTHLCCLIKRLSLSLDVMRAPPDSQALTLHKYPLGRSHWPTVKQLSTLNAIQLF